MEVNGPLHYRNETQKLIWRKEKKIRQLKKLGMKVSVLPYFEWDNIIEISDQRFKYIKQKISE